MNTDSADGLTGGKKADSFFSKNVDLEELGKQLLIELSSTPDQDGQPQGTWLLTMIDHWNHEHEEVIVLMENAYYVVKYDFVTKKPAKSTRIELKNVLNVSRGPIVYPINSWAKSRDGVAVRLLWGDLSHLSVWQRWNPLTKEYPCHVFMDHPLQKCSEGERTDSYAVDKFLSSYENVTKQTVESANIEISTYGNLSSVVFNESKLGYSRNRNGISF